VSELGGLETGLAELASALEDSGSEYMVIGGLTVLVWGRPRATQDVDVTVRIPEENLAEFVAFIGRRLFLLPEQPVEFLRETHVLPLTTPSGVRVDLIWAVLPYEQQAVERAIVRRFGEVNLRICTAEDLIVHKLASTRPRDWEDVIGVVARQRSALDRLYLDPIVRDLAEGLEDFDMWERYRQLVEA
jgi:hypothetical protein